MTIVILGTANDEHASAVARNLETRGKKVKFLDSGSFPGINHLTLNPDCDEISGGGQIRFDDGLCLAWDEIDAVYWRSFSQPQVQGLEDPEQHFIATNDSRSLFESFLWEAKTRWVNGIRGFELHQRKPACLALAARLGVRIPQTVITNDPQVVKDFADRIPKAIFKPVQGGAHTQILLADHLTDANLQNLKVSPVTLQEEVPGTDVRVFVAGKKVLACEIRSASMDFRDDAFPDISPIDLPTEIAELSLQIAGALHLVWTGIDFRRTPDDEYVFFEANPSPMFLGFQSRTGLPLLEALVDLLLDEELAAWRESER